MLAIYQGYCAVFLLGETLFCVCVFLIVESCMICVLNQKYTSILFFQFLAKF